MNYTIPKVKLTEKFKYGDTVVARCGKSAIYGTYYDWNPSREVHTIKIDDAPGSNCLFEVHTSDSHAWPGPFTLERYTPTVAEILDRLPIGSRFRMNGDVEGSYYMKASTDAFVHVDTFGFVSTAAHRRSNFSDDERVIVVKG